MRPAVDSRLPQTLGLRRNPALAMSQDSSLPLPLETPAAQYFDQSVGVAAYRNSGALRTQLQGGHETGVAARCQVRPVQARSTQMIGSALALAREREQTLVSSLGVRPPVRLLSVALTLRRLREPTVALHEAGRYIRAGVTAFTLRTPLRPNHSVELRANGLSPGPRYSAGVHYL